MYFTSPTSVLVENGTLDGGSNRLSLEGEQLLETGFESNGKILSTTEDCIGSCSLEMEPWKTGVAVQNNVIYRYADN